VILCAAQTWLVLALRARSSRHAHRVAVERWRRGLVTVAFNRLAVERRRLQMHVAMQRLWHSVRDGRLHDAVHVRTEEVLDAAAERQVCACICWVCGCAVSPAVAGTQSCVTRG
jgi:hypothetical protein